MFDLDTFAASTTLYVCRYLSHISIALGLVFGNRRLTVTLKTLYNMVQNMQVIILLDK